MRAACLVVLLSIAAPALADHFHGVTLAADGAALVLHTDRGDVAAPRNEPGQQGFAEPHISPDGRTAGWLVLEANCCASYPLPAELVLFRDGRIVQRLAGRTVIWAWTFSPDGKAVAWRERTAHGASGIVYSLRRISDGHELASFACDLKQGTPAGQEPVYVHDTKVPSWVWPIAEECPSR